MKKICNKFILPLLVLGVVASQSAIAAPGKGTLFGTDAFGQNLISINVTTGVGTIIGFSPFLKPSLAASPSGMLFAGQGGGTPQLWTLDKATGVATLVGNSGLGFAAIGGMDFDTNGILYAAVNIAGAAGTGSDHLATLNTNTGVAAVIGPFGPPCSGVSVPSTGVGSCAIEGIEGIAFDAAGILWGSNRNRNGTGAQGLYTINTATGQATFVRPLLDGVGNPPNGIVSLQFACDGTLYGGTSRNDGGFLVTINANTGIFTPVSAVSATGGPSLGGLAFDDTNCAIQVTIDIKPGSDPNSINLCTMGVVPVAILSTATFDATDVDPGSLTLADAGVKMVGKSNKELCRFEDVDDDGDIDLVCKFTTVDLVGLDESSINAILKGTLSDLTTPIEGSDAIRIVKDDC